VIVRYFPRRVVTVVLIRPTDQAVDGRNMCAPCKVHQKHCEEVQDGGFQGHDDAYEYNYNS
jgi:hypothetical protein